MFPVVLQAPPFFICITTDGSFDNAFVLLDQAFYQREISFLDKFSLELLRKYAMDADGLCDNHQTGGLFVQTVNEARANECGMRNAECGICLNCGMRSAECGIRGVI